MKKIFTLVFAALASFSLWAADPDISFEIPASGASKSDYFKDWTIGSSVITLSATMDLSSNDSQQNISISSAAGNLNANYISIKVKSGAATIDSIAFLAGGSGNNKGVNAPLIGWTTGYAEQTTTANSLDYIAFTSASSGGAKIDNANWYVADFYGDGIKEVRIYKKLSKDQVTIEGEDTSSDLGSGETIRIWGMKIWLNPGCQAPANALVLSANKTSDIYEGDEITFSTTGGNDGTITIAGANSETITNNVWTATVGTHTFTASQAQNGNVCAQESELVLNVAAASPVSAVSVAGETSAYVGSVLTYTATAANATAYEWYLDDVKQGSDSAKFIYTAVKGSHSIVCKARNKFNVDPQWISSDAIALIVTNPSGSLISYTVENGSGNIDKDFTVPAGVNNLIGGSGHQKTQKNGKLGSNGHYISLQLAQGSFLTGDTVAVVIMPEYNSDKGTYSMPATLKISTDVNNTEFIGEATGWPTTGSENVTAKIVLTEDASVIYLARTSSLGQNPIVVSISVIRPKAVDHTTESLTGAAINDAPLAAADLATLLSSHTLILQDSSYVDAPVVKFTKHLVITYEDESVSERDEVISVTSQQAEATTWGAATTINEIAYSVYTVKKSSFAVRYMDGETELGTENVEANGHPANYAQYQYKNLYTFVGWYNNADLADEHLVADMSAEVITAAATYYAKFTEKYAASINFEKAVMENGKGYAIINQLGTLGYSTNITGSLDSLDNSKTDSLRNYAYLGLKVKQNGALLNFRLEEGKTVNIKFGNIAKTPQVSINGGEFADMTITDKVYTRTAAANEVISIKMMDVNAVVFQQIMIGDLEAPELFAINCAEAENGTVAAQYKLGIPGEVIALTITPAEGYKIGTVTVNSEEIQPVEDAYSFTMPAAVANVSASFGETTGIENTNAEMKAVKRLENGMLIIEKNGAIYNIIGACVK